MAIRDLKGQTDLLSYLEPIHQDTTARLRSALARLVGAVDALHPHDDIIRELVIAGIGDELADALSAAVDVLNETE